MIYTTDKTNVEAKIREAFNFTVDKFPLAGPENMATPWYGLFRSDTMQVVGTSSKTGRYFPHQTSDVVALAAAAGQTFDGEFDVKCHFNNGHHVIVEPTKGERLKVFGETDSVLPRIIINAGYDGRAFRATLGFYRDMCTNLQMFHTVKGTTVAIRHTSGLPSKMDSLVSTFGRLAESWQSLKDQIMEMESKQVDFQWLLDQVYPKTEGQTPRQSRARDRKFSQIFSRLNREAAASNRPARDGIRVDSVSGWEAYNAIQGYVQHDSPSRRTLWIDRALHAARSQRVRTTESLILATSA